MVCLHSVRWHWATRASRNCCSIQCIYNLQPYIQRRQCLSRFFKINSLSLSHKYVKTFYIFVLKRKFVNYIELINLDVRKKKFSFGLLCPSLVIIDYKIIYTNLVLFCNYLLILCIILFPYKVEYSNRVYAGRSIFCNKILSIKSIERI